MSTLARPTLGSVYYAFNSITESAEWCTVTGSHWGLLLDPPAPVEWTGAVFTSREAAEAYRAAARPGSVAASDRPLVRVQWRGGALFRIVPEAATS